ncbi:MAG: glycosyltransferase [Ktedonobacteraceae bacterium]
MANTVQRTILFLIADTGAGHRSAANAIRNAIEVISQQEQEAWQAKRQKSVEGIEGETKPVMPPTSPEVPSSPPPTYRIEIVDVFEEYSRFPLREAVKLYGPTIRYNPKLYGRVFHLSNESSRVAAVKTVATPLIHNGLLQLITSVQPDVIVSIHAMLNHVTIAALRDLHLNIPFITVVTDLISVHYAWFAPGADCYIVPTEQAKQLYLERDLDPELVRVIGMPIDPKFTRPTESKEELRRKFGLAQDIPVVLLVGGGEGSGGLQEAVRAISRARLPVQILIITGRNKRLYAHLQRTRSSLHVPAKVYGFVQNMPEMMRASDVIVTKAGPGTIAEALACDLPIILSGYVPGQEEGNVDYVLKNEVGVLAHDAIELVDTLRLLIKPGSLELRRWHENAQRMSRPRASFDIAGTILSFLPAAQEPGIWQTARWRKRRRTLLAPLSAEVRSRAAQRKLPRMSRVSFLRSPVMRRLAHLRSTGLSYRRTRMIDIDQQQDI